jgi:hypothetical protein
MPARERSQACSVGRLICGIGGRIVFLFLLADATNSPQICEVYGPKGLILTVVN